LRQTANPLFMNSESFEELKRIVAKLNKGEAKIAGNYISAFDLTKNKEENKLLKLIKLIREKPTITKTKAHDSICKIASTASFDKQVLRLKKKVLSSLLVDYNITRNGIYDDRSRNWIEVRKKFMHARIIFWRGLDKEAFKLYDEIIEKSKKYEIYDILIDVLRQKQFDTGLRLGKKEFDKYDPDINHYEKCKDGVNKSLRWYYLHFIENIDRKGLRNSEIERLKTTNKELFTLYKETNSTTIGFYLYCLKIEIHLATEKYTAACKAGLELIEHIKKNPAICSKPRLGNAHSDLADNYLFLYDFKKVMFHAKTAQSYFKQSTYNYDANREIEFLAAFYNNESTKAYNIIHSLRTKTDSELIPFQHSKRCYMEACALFLQKKYTEAYLLLNETIVVEKEDKEGWNIGIRILSIIINIELLKLSLAESKIEALRKFISRATCEKPFRKREVIILKILRRLEDNSFNFKATYSQQHSELKCLASKEKPYRWEIKTPEMIVFHKWFHSKTEGLPYQFSIPKE
jgi:hypothetical protein